MTGEQSAVWQIERYMERHGGVDKIDRTILKAAVGGILAEIDSCLPEEIHGTQPDQNLRDILVTSGMDNFQALGEKMLESIVKVMPGVTDRFAPSGPNTMIIYCMRERLLDLIGDSILDPIVDLIVDSFDISLDPLDSNAIDITSQLVFVSIDKSSLSNIRYSAVDALDEFAPDILRG